MPAGPAKTRSCRLRRQRVLIEAGIPTENLVAHVLVAKYADHCPLYRQTQIYSRQGVDLDRSTLADWVGRAAALLAPLQTRLFEILKASPKLFADETRCPVLDPGRKRVKRGQLWAYARDDRPWGGGDPPAVVYCYAPGRGSEHVKSHLKGFSGILQVDGYAAYKDLASSRPPSEPLILSFCRVDGDVASPVPHRPGRADFPHPVPHAEVSLRERRAGERPWLWAEDVWQA